MIILENESLQAKIHPKGAELQSLKHRNGLEYMWSGDPAYWGKFSPILFPIVGTLKQDTYYYQNNPYTLSRHGFARDRVFEVDQISPFEAVFTLTNDAESRLVYPFAFELKLRYRLVNDRLFCSYEVSNPANEKLWFSIGGHPAFALPMVAETSYTDYQLDFEKAEPLLRYKLENGLIGTETTIVQTEQMEQPDGRTATRLKLNQDLFAEDAIVLKNLQSNWMRLSSNLHDHGLTFYLEGFPYFGIWAAPGAPFICLEPWCGIADSVNHNQQWEEKEGIIGLEPGLDWRMEWSVQCY